MAITDANIKGKKYKRNQFIETSTSCRHFQLNGPKKWPCNTYVIFSNNHCVNTNPRLVFINIPLDFLWRLNVFHPPCAVTCVYFSKFAFVFEQSNYLFWRIPSSNSMQKHLGTRSGQLVADVRFEGRHVRRNCYIFFCSLTWMFCNMFWSGCYKPSGSIRKKTGSWGFELYSQIIPS